MKAMLYDVTVDLEAPVASFTVDHVPIREHDGITVRVDTAELVRTRAMTTDERQSQLFGGEVSDGE